LFNNTNSIRGYCKSFFLIENESPENVLTISSDGSRICNHHLLSHLTPLVKHKWAHLVCESQYADQSGKCMTPPVSLKRGEECSSNSECLSSGETGFAQCKCGFSTTGKKYCDILPGDVEWIDANRKVLN